MPSFLFDSIHSRTMLGVVCYHRPWKACTIRWCQPGHVIITLWQHTRSDDVGCGMLAWPLGSTHSRITLGVACHHRPWRAHTDEWRHAWHAIITLWLQTRSDYVGRGIPSWTLASTHFRVWLTIITIGQHTQGRTTTGVACYHHAWKAYTI